MSSIDEPQSPFVETGEATAIMPVRNGATPITVIGTPAIRDVR